MLNYKINVLDALKKAGYTTTDIKKKKLLAQRTMQALREEEIVGPVALNHICCLLNMQPGDILEYVKDEDDLLPSRKLKPIAKSKTTQTEDADKGKSHS